MNKIKPYKLVWEIPFKYYSLHTWVISEKFVYVAKNNVIKALDKNTGKVDHQFEIKMNMTISRLAKMITIYYSHHVDILVLLKFGILKLESIFTLLVINTDLII